MVKGLEPSLNARVQDESSALHCLQARREPGRASGCPLCPAEVLCCSQRSFPEIALPHRGCGPVNLWVRFALPGLGPQRCQQDRARHKADKVLGFQSCPCRGTCRAVSVLGGWECMKY